MTLDGSLYGPHEAANLGSFVSTDALLAQIETRDPWESLAQVGAEQVAIYRAALPPKATAAPPLGKRTDFVADDHRTLRKQREWLREASGRILGVKRIQECGSRTAYSRGGGTKFPVNETRSTPIPTERVSGVSVRMNDQGRASFGGIARCGAGWTCPVCAPIITERRRNEVIKALSAHRARKGGVPGTEGGCCLVTLTVVHGRADSLSDVRVADEDGPEATRTVDGLISRMNEARRFLMQSKAWARIKRNYGWVGEIRALEATWGRRNGWHPHFHILWLTKSELSVERQQQLRAELYSLWVEACGYVNLPEPSEEHGVDVRDGDHAGEYATKWGLAEELTKVNVASDRKKAKAGNRTPWAILMDAAAGDAESAALWCEWGRATKRKAGLTWSKGLRKRLGLTEAEPTDEEIVEQEQETGKVVVRLSAERKDGALSDWFVLVRARRQLEVLDLVEKLHEGGAPPQTIQHHVDELIGRLRRLQNPRAFADHVLATFYREEQ